MDWRLGCVLLYIVLRSVSPLGGVLDRIGCLVGELKDVLFSGLEMLDMASRRWVYRT